MSEAATPPQEEEASRKQVYLRCNGRALRTTVAQVVEFFQTAGKPTSVRNRYGEEPPNGDIYETAIVTFKKNKAVQKALALSGTELEGRAVIVGINNRPPHPRRAAQGSCRVYVGNLPFEARDEHIRDFFSNCGKILFVRFKFKDGVDKVSDGNGHAGYCFVIFGDPDGSEAAAEAALALDGTELLGRPLRVSVAATNKIKSRSRNESNLRVSKKKRFR